MENRFKTIPFGSAVTTPVKSETPSQYLSGYEPVEKSFLVSGFSKGFRIPFTGELPTKSGIRNHPSALKNTDKVTEKILGELTAGRIERPFKNKPVNLMCSPLALVPKKEPGKFRLIQYLSFPKGGSINDRISTEYTEIQYDSIDVVVEKVKTNGRNCLMAKTDIENAFRIIQIHPADRHFLGFSWALNGTPAYYMDACLDMGLSISC